MATTIQNVNLANTFGEWVNITNETVTGYNKIYADDFTKPAGTLYLTTPGTALVVSNTAVYTGLIDVASSGALLVRRNAEIQNTLALSNKDGGGPNSLVLSANGVANLNFINVTGNGLAANVSNNMFIGGTLSVTGNTSVSANLSVTRDITGNNLTILSNSNVLLNSRVGQDLYVFGEAYHENPVWIDSTLQVGGATELGSLDVNTNILTVTFNSSGVSRANDFVSNTAVVSPMIHASVGANVQYLSSNTDVVASSNTVTNNLQANTAANTRTLSVTGTTSTNFLQANTAANTRTLSVTGLTSTDGLQANTAANTRTLSVTGMTLTDGLQANTAANTRTLSVTGTTSTNVLQANTLVNTPTVNAVSLVTRTLQANTSANTSYLNASIATIGSSATVETLTSNTNIVANNGTVWANMLSAPNIRSTGSIISGSISSTSGVFDSVTVSGNFNITGSTVYSSNVFVLLDGNPLPSTQSAQFATLRASRNTANAELRWNNNNRWWEVYDVPNASYLRLLNSNDYVSINTSFSTAISANIAATNNNIASNVSNLQAQISANAVSTNAVVIQANTAMRSYVDANVALLNNRISSNIATVNSTITTNVNNLQTQITANSISSNAVISKANTDLKNYTDSTFVRLTSSSQSITGDITVSGNLVVSGTTIDASRLETRDSLIKLGKDNTVSDSIDIGFYSPYQTGGATRYTGLFRKAGDRYFLVQSVVDEPTSNTFGPLSPQASFRATLDANFTGGTVSGLASPIAVLDGGTGTSTSTGSGALVLNTSPSIASVTLTGSPVAPTAANGTFSTVLATTAFVQNANTILRTYVDATKVASVSGTSGQIFSSGGLNPTLNLISTGTTTGTFGGAAVVPVLTVDTFGRTTSSANVTIAIAPTQITSTTGTGAAVLAVSPTMTGTPLAPTAADGTSNTMIASTAFVQSANTGLRSYVDLTKADLSGATFTGAVASPTPLVAANNTTLATTAFVRNLLSAGGTWTINVTGNATNITQYAIEQNLGPSNGVQFGSLRIGNTAGSPASGEIRATGDIVAFDTSDRTLKENIVNIDSALEKVNNINGVYFDWTEDYIKEHGGEDGYFVRKHDVGVIAQEIELVLPEVVGTRENGTKAVKYEKLVPLLIEAIKELSRENQEIKNQLKDLSK